MRTFTATDPQSHKGNDSWLTPISIVNALGEFDLDPCGFKHHKTAKRIIELPEDGLVANWEGRVWLNPPYSNAKTWIDRMKEHRNGCVLIFSRTGTLADYMKDCDHLFFLRKRIRFLTKELVPAKFSPGSDSMILAYGSCDFSKLEGVQIK